MRKRHVENCQNASGYDMIVAMKNPITRRADYFKNSGEQRQNSRCRRCSFVRRTVVCPGFPRRIRYRWLIICRSNSKNSKGCPGHDKARCLCASSECIRALTGGFAAQPVAEGPYLGPFEGTRGGDDVIGELVRQGQ